MSSTGKGALSPADRVLLGGATGYIGGRLVPRLLEAGLEVVCLARSARKVRARPWAREEAVTVVEGEVGDERALESPSHELRVC